MYLLIDDSYEYEESCGWGMLATISYCPNHVCRQLVNQPTAQVRLSLKERGQATSHVFCVVVAPDVGKIPLSLLASHTLF